MSDSNQYQTPQSQVDQQVPQEFAQPKIFSVSGRIGRMRFLAYVVGAQIIIGMPANLLGMFLGTALAAEGQMMVLGVSAITTIILFVFYFMFAIQRSHDMNSSGWLS